RGFSILEVLVVVVLLGAIVAISLPFLGTRVEERAWAEAGTQIQDTVIRLRAESQRSGKAIRLTVEHRGAAVRLVRQDLDLQGSFDPDAFENADTEWGEVAQAFLDTFDRPMTPVLTLPDGVDLLDADPRLDASFGVPTELGGVVDAGLDAFGVEFDDDPVTLCVFLPDGSVMRGTSFYLYDEDRLARLDVSTWTGDVTWNPLDLDATGDLATDEDDDAPDLEGAMGPGDPSGGSPGPRAPGSRPEAPGP
ncbi:MAG: prepilin-type N-terminal cleavage/methylation domain-containing protein, partial [Phycisphaerales bacterium]|nr:prepilin-type N-terminal cleavage/methylation domain-containing protein [Phycisphaerales bacterium]